LVEPQDHRRGLAAGRLVCVLASTILASVSLAAPRPDLPTAVSHADRLRPAADVPLRVAPAVDRAQVAREDIERETAGLAPRFAIPHRVDLTPQTAGIWEEIDSGTSVWRLRVGSPGAVSLNLGLTRYFMPPGGRLLVYSSDLVHALPPFGSEDNAAHGELWTPVVPASEVVLEVTLPTAERAALVLKLESINVGYRGFGETLLAGACNVDVVCPQGDPWRAEIASVGVISTGGSLFCTGFMVNNTANDRRPYFMTARHCGITAANAASLVVYWNYQTSTCGGPRDGQLNQFQSGAFFCSSNAASDFTLVELDSAPNSAWGVTFAGWDRSGANTSGAIAIHHPNTDEKSISFENQPTTTTSYLGSSSPGDGTHVRITDWDVGTTESGSSGSPLFDPAHRVIGQLHGGFAACGNNDSDWYGKFAISWNGGGTSATRLSNWLDPGATGAVFLDTLAGVCDHDDVCDHGEDCLTCPDDCISQEATAACGDGICHTAEGENCVSCPADCNGQTGGPQSGRYCCGQDAPCTDSRCSASGNTCSAAPLGQLYCCGDLVCENAEDDSNCAIDCLVPGCGDHLCDPGRGESSCSCPGDCGAPPADETGAACADGLDNDCDGPIDCADAACASGSSLDGDGDGRRRCQDCADWNSAVWAAPGEATEVTFVGSGSLTWTAPAAPGAVGWAYDVLRSTSPSDFMIAECVATGLGTTGLFEPAVPPAGGLASYLVRAVNACPNVGIGPLGFTSSGIPRTAPACP
jgi:hypothetical protein